MEPKTPFNNWVIVKIMNYLKHREGFHTVYPPSYTVEGTRVIVQDVFGYQYEVTVRMTGRIMNESLNEEGVS